MFCAQGGSAAALQPSRADLAKAMVKFGLPTLSISMADPAMSLVDTVVIGAFARAGLTGCCGDKPGLL